MRITLTLGAEIHRTAKQLAAAQGRTLSAVVSGLVREDLKEPRDDVPVLHLPRDAERGYRR